jgi:hypothetical protein
MQAAQAREIIKAQSRFAAERLLARERFIGGIYDAWHSDDGIADAFVRNGNSVFITSINIQNYDRGVQHIVTEPPLVVGRDRLDGGEVTVRKGLELATGKIALLLPAGWMTRPQAKRLFAETPIARIYIMSRKLRFRPGPMAWYVFEKGTYDPPHLHLI